MTLPRWWNNRFMLGLVLTTLVLAGSVHLWSFAPGEVPFALIWVFYIFYLAVALGYFLWSRHPRPQPPAPPTTLRGSFWHQLRAPFTTGPLWLRLFNYARALLAGYWLISIVLVLADYSQNGILRWFTLFAVHHCLLWLRTYLTTRPVPGAGRLPL